jgi:hypothetical protein
MPPNPIADRALPLVAPAIERVYRNSEHLGQVSHRHESLADIEGHDHLRSIRVQDGHQARQTKHELVAMREDLWITLGPGLAPFAVIRPKALGCGLAVTWRDTIR